MNRIDNANRDNQGNRQRTLSQEFRTPTVLAALSLVGLVSALIGDDQYDIWSWLALVTLPLIIVWMIWIKPRPGARR